MQRFSKYWLFLILSIVANLGHSEPDMGSVIPYITGSDIFKGDDWVLVREPEEKFESAYKKIKMEQKARRTKANPDLLQSQERHEAKAKKVFLHFRKGDSDYYRAGLLYIWPCNGCDYWKYDYRGFLGNGNNPPVDALSTGSIHVGPPIE